VQELELLVLGHVPPPRQGARRIPVTGQLWKADTDRAIPNAQFGLTGISMGDLAARGIL